MKLTFVFVFVFILGLSANTLSQQRVTLKMGQTTYGRLFEEIQDKTGHYIIYNNKRLDKDEKVVANFFDESLDNIFRTILKDKNLIHQFKDEFIVLKPFEKVKNTADKKVTIKGKVVDEKGNPLPGVTVVIKGTKVGISTDVKGVFNISGEKGDILVVSFIGMKTQEVKYLGKELTIKMEEDTQVLDEVVVNTGYEKIDKRKLTSSVYKVKAVDVVEPVSLSLDQMLQGKIPGMVVTNRSSTPGVAARVRVRGNASISGNREPLWVLNGIVLKDPVPLKAEDLNSLDYVNLIGNAISSINPEDIEDITVLKDATATALYGSRAANGVIVVTTKRGKKGAPSISLSNSFSLTTKPTRDGMYRMNEHERLDVSMEMHRRGLYFRDCEPCIVGYEKILLDLWSKKISYQDYINAIGDLERNSTDWYDVLFRNAFSNNHTFSMSGASENTDYYFSLGYGNQNGATKGVGMNRYSTSANINTRINEKIRTGFSLSASYSVNERFIGSVDPYKYAYETSPLLPAYNSDGTLHFYQKQMGYGGGNVKQLPLNYNIINEKKHGASTNTNKTLNLSGYLDYNITDWLRFNTTFGFSLSGSSQESWADEKSYEVAVLRDYPYGVPLPKDDGNFGSSVCKLPYGGYISNSDTDNKSYTFRCSLNASKNWGLNGVSGSFGVEANSSTYQGKSGTRYGYLHDRGRQFIVIDDHELWAGYAQKMLRNVDKITDRTSNFASYYATFCYSYDNRYVINFNVRGDASNEFGQDKDARFLPIWSVSGRWNIYKEGIFDNVQWLNSFSLRASYGIQGNVSIENSPYLICSRGGLDSDSEEYISTLSSLPNPKLKWEKTKSTNVGLDFSLFDNLIYGNVEYYNRLGVDQIIQRRITTTNGARTHSLNAGNIVNRGLEISFSINPINTKDLGLGFSFNTSKNYNEVTNCGITNFGYTDYVNGTIVMDGYPVNTFFSYQFNGLDHATGRPTFKNLCEYNDEGEKIFFKEDPHKFFRHVFVESGQREPDISGGFSTTFRYKRFTANMGFSFMFGAKTRLNPLYPQNKVEIPSPDMNMSSEFSDRWRKPGDENFTNIPALTSKDMSYNNFKKYNNKGVGYSSTIYPAYSYYEMYNNSDLRVVSQNYVKCNNTSLRYTFDSSICKKLYVKRLSIGASVNNLFTIKHSSMKGRDPEQIKLGSGTIPPQRTYSLSLSVGF